MKLMKILLLCLIIPFSAPCKAQTQVPALGGRIPTDAGPEFPASPVGKIAHLFVEVVNSGDRAAVLNFITSRITAAGLKQTPADEYLALFQKMHVQSGGIEVIYIRPSDSHQSISFNVRSKRGNRWARVFMRSNDSQPEKLDGVGVLPIPDPEAEKAFPWSNGKLDERGVTNEIGRHAERAAAQDIFSGVVLVSKGDRVIFHRAYGQAEKSFGVPNKLDTKFHLGSMGKMFTSVAIAQLVQAGKLSFDDTLAKLLPEYPNKEAAGKITINHLLTHTAGLGGFFDRPLYNRRQRYKTQAEYIPVFANEPLLFEPGTRASYSNEGFIVLGAVIEKVTGQNYLDYVREHIFKPAGMKDTDAYALDETTPNLAVGYMRSDDDPFGVEPRRPNFMFLGWRGNACGGSYSTAPDMLRFAQALRGYKLLGKDLTEKVTGQQGQQGLMPGYGYGFETREVSGKSVRGHSGGGPNSGINSDLKIFWDGSYTVAVLGNYDAPAAQALARRICDFLALQ